MTRLAPLAAGLLLASSSIAMAAEGDMSTPEEVDQVTGVVGMDGRSDRPRGIYFMYQPAAGTPRLGPGPKHRIVYLNRNGGTYSPGNENSAANTSIVPNAVSQVSAWSYGDAAWNQFVQCVKLQFSRFDVEITEVEPASNVLYIENVVGGTPGQVGLPNGVGGVAPFTNDCSVVERGVTYTFSAVYQGNVQAICETTAQEVSHALGLDHEYLCEDPMTYLFGCGPKTFQDQTVACGEDGPRACACGGQQNSVQALLQVLGPADQLPPNVDIDQPAQGATVSPGFSVVASASDNGSVTKVELLIDGSLVDTRTAAPYTFSAPTSLAAGAHSIEVRATDNAGKSSSAQVSVNLQTGGGGDGGGGDGGGGNGNGSGDGDGDGSGNGDGSGGGANDDGIGDPPQVFGGCSAAGGGSERRGTAALLLVAAALLLAWRRRA